MDVVVQLFERVLPLKNLSLYDVLYYRDHLSLISFFDVPVQRKLKWYLIRVQENVILHPIWSTTVSIQYASNDLTRRSSTIMVMDPQQHTSADKQKMYCTT